MTPLLIASLLAALPGPLTEYLRAAESHNHALQISRAQLRQQEAAAQQSLAQLTPNVQISGSYIRNQYNAALTFPNTLLGLPGSGETTLVIQPYNQLQGVIGLNVPLIEPTAIAHYGEGRHAAAAADQSERASDLDVQLSVARAYYQLVAVQGVLVAAQRSFKTSQDALAIAQSKFAAGTTNKLTVERAEVDVARAQQIVADAQYNLGVYRRNLETLSGLPVEGDLPAVGPAEPLSRDEVDYVAAAERQRPELRQAREAIEQAQGSRDEAWTTLAPSLVGQAQEHLTNYSGFVGHDEYWTLGVNLLWTLDPVATPAALKRASGALAEQEARLAQALDSVRDEVHSAWLQVIAFRAHVEETRAEQRSSSEALRLSQEQFAAGTATSLDLSQAERDAFTAEANAAQSASDLATALLALQKAAGEPLLEASR